MDKFLGLIPFIFMQMDNNGKQKPKINFPRVLEAVLIAVIGGAFAGYIAVAQMKVEVVHIKEDVCDIKTEIKSCNDKFLGHLEKYHSKP